MRAGLRRRPLASVSSLAAQYRMLGIPVYKLDPIFFRVLP